MARNGFPNKASYPKRTPRENHQQNHLRRQGQGTGIGKLSTLVTKAQRASLPPTQTLPPTPRPPKPQQSHMQVRAVVLHAAPTTYKPGKMWCWVEEDNQGSIQILGIRWLVQGDRMAGRGKLVSSLVVYLKDKVNIKRGIRMKRKIFRTTQYDWGRY